MIWKNIFVEWSDSMDRRQMEQILQKIAALQGGVRIIAIDGCCASGKSTMAELLAEKTNAGIIHMDDFFLPGELRTRERLSQPGGNVHYERFCEEVLPKLRKTEDFAYGRFECGKMQITGKRPVRGSGIYIVEGAYSCHPVLGAYMDLKIFSCVSKNIQLQRILDRGGEEALNSFKERWIPMEEAYFRAYQIKEQADLIIDSSCT